MAALAGLAERVDDLEARLRREMAARSRARMLVAWRTEGRLIPGHALGSPVLAVLNASRLYTSSYLSNFDSRPSALLLLDAYGPTVGRGKLRGAAVWTLQFAATRAVRACLARAAGALLSLPDALPGRRQLLPSLGFSAAYTMLCDTLQFTYHEVAARRTPDPGLAYLHRQRQASLLSWTNVLRHCAHAVPGLALRALNLEPGWFGQMALGTFGGICDLFIDRHFFVEHWHRGISLRPARLPDPAITSWGGPSRDQIEIPAPLVCPITLDLLVDPVVLTTSCRCMSRAAAIVWIRQHGTDPINRARVTVDDLVPVPEMQALVVEFAAAHGLHLPPSSTRRPLLLL